MKNFKASRDFSNTRVGNFETDQVKPVPTALGEHFKQMGLGDWVEEDSGSDEDTLGGGTQEPAKEPAKEPAQKKTGAKAKGKK